MKSLFLCKRRNVYDTLPDVIVETGTEMERWTSVLVMTSMSVSHKTFLLTGSLTQAIRNFAKSLENWLKGAMANVPDEMIKTKVRLTVGFSL